MDKKIPVLSNQFNADHIRANHYVKKIASVTLKKNFMYSLFQKFIQIKNKVQLIHSKKIGIRKYLSV